MAVVGSGLATAAVSQQASATIKPPVAAIHTGPEGGSPLDVAVDTSTGRVYTANSGSGTVSVIDGRADYFNGGRANPLLATVHVGAAPWAVAVDPLTDMVYSANHGSNSVTVINGHDDKVVATVNNIVHPLGIAVVDATDRIYVTDGRGGNRGASDVDVIDGHTNRVVANVPVGIAPWGVGVNQLSQRVYVANSAGSQLGPSGYFVGSVTVLQGTSPVATIGVGPVESPEWVGVDQIHNRVYVSVNDYEDVGSAGAVVVINSSTNRAIDQIDMPDPQGIAVDPGTGRAYVAEGYQNDFGGPLYIIDTKVNEIAEIVNVSVNPDIQAVGTPWGIAVDPETERVFMAEDATPGVVNVVDLGGYYIPAPSPVPSSSVPSAPVSTAATTTTVGKPTTTVPNMGPAPVNTWCWLLRKAGGNVFFTGTDNGAATIVQNGPLSGSKGCYYFSGSAHALLGPFANKGAPGEAPYEVLPALGNGAGVWIYGISVQLWWPHKTGWLELELDYTVGQTAAQRESYIPDMVAVAKKVQAILG